MPTAIVRRTRRTAALLAAMGALVALAAAAPARADGPALDPSFGTGGISALTRPNDASIEAILVLPDGRILAAGQERTIGFLLARYRADGTLDPTFGTNGVTTTMVGADGTADAEGIALQGDDIILEGTSHDAGAQSVATVARYTAGGTLDTTFAGGVGWAQVSSTYARFGNGVAIQADRKILVGGAKNGAVVMRLGADTGVLDPSFNSIGVAGIPGNLGGCSDDASSGVRNLFVTPAGIVAGILCGGRNGTLQSAGIARFTDTGGLDPSFGSSGVTTFRADPLKPSFGATLARTSDGSFVRAVQNGFGGAPNTVVAARWTSGGVLDPTFGTGGVSPAFTFAASSSADVTAVDQRDRPLVAGTEAGLTAKGGLDVLRLTAAGIPDPLWNGGVPFHVPVGDGATEPMTLAVQPDGRILVAGIASQGGKQLLAIARLLPPPEPAPPAVIPISSPAPAAKRPTFAGAVLLPSAKRCVSRRRFRIRLRNPTGLTIRSALVTVNARRVRSVKGKGLTAPIDLRGLPKGRFTVRVTLKLSDGSTLRGSRAYRTCTAKKRTGTTKPRR